MNSFYKILQGEIIFILSFQNSQTTLLVQILVTFCAFEAAAALYSKPVSSCVESSHHLMTYFYHTTDSHYLLKYEHNRVFPMFLTTVNVSANV